MKEKKLLILDRYFGFDWDHGNSDKNWLKHGVTKAECEEIFFNQPFLLADDVLHSTIEQRYYALGHTDAGRKVFIVFTVRNNLIRIISARDINRKEKTDYERQEKNS